MSWLHFLDTAWIFFVAVFVSEMLGKYSGVPIEKILCYATLALVLFQRKPDTMNATATMTVDSIRMKRNALGIFECERGNVFGTEDGKWYCQPKHPDGTMAEPMGPFPNQGEAVQELMSATRSRP
jgi:hypothetical protein